MLLPGPGYLAPVDEKVNTSNDLDGHDGGCAYSSERFPHIMKMLSSKIEGAAFSILVLLSVYLEWHI